MPAVEAADGAGDAACRRAIGHEKLSVEGLGFSTSFRKRGSEYINGLRSLLYT